MKERFSKLLLGGSGKGVCSAITISNAITDLYATIYGNALELEPLKPEEKMMWEKERDCLLSLCDYIVEFVPEDDNDLEVMCSRPRTDIQMNLPALWNLDGMLMVKCLYGGDPKGPQLSSLDRGFDIVVAAPGHLNDILEMRRVSLEQVSCLVLDDADRMLDMGFEPQIGKIVKEVPTRRQTLMYTATWPKEVQKIAADLLSNPVQANIGNMDELVANKSITQHVEVLAYYDKQRRMENMLSSQEPGSKIIIFCATEKMCDLLARNLSCQFGIAAIHGDKSQSERDQVLSQFRSGSSPVLVATDVAARFLNVKDIRVVNHDFEEYGSAYACTGIEDYVHRIGRTGRAGATELATFFNDQDSKYASHLVKILEGASQKVPREVRDMALGGGRMGWGRRQRGSDSGGHDGGRCRRGYSSYGGSDGGRGRGSYDADGRGNYGVYQSKNFGGGDRDQSWNSECRSRSRSPERFNQGSSFSSKATLRIS